MGKLSALNHWAEHAGAALTTHFGWRTPARFTDPQQETAQVTTSAGLADLSWMSKFDLKGDAKTGWQLGPRHFLITCDPAARPAMPGDALVTDVTSVFAQFLLAGPSARAILAKLSSMNVSEGALPDAGCRQTSLAHVHATVARQDLQSIPAFHLLVARDYAEFVWEAVLHAGHEFHLVPFGLDALRALGG